MSWPKRLKKHDSFVVTATRASASSSPSSPSSRVACGSRLMPTPTALMPGADSYTRHGMPRACSASASVSPPTPAPTMRMSCGLAWVKLTASDEGCAPGKAFALEAGDALVILRERGELFGSDHILDAFERPVAASLVHRAQDRIRACGAVGEHHLVGGREARGLVCAQRDRHVRRTLQAAGERARIEDRLPGPVRAPGIHRVRRVAEQRDASLRPERQRFAVDHRVFENGLGPLEQRDDV